MLSCYLVLITCEFILGVLSLPAVPVGGRSEHCPTALQCPWVIGPAGAAWAVSPFPSSAPRAGAQPGWAMGLGHGAPGQPSSALPGPGAAQPPPGPATA